MTNKPTDCDDFVQRFIGAQARLYGYIVTFVPSRSDADELFQQTSLVLWQKREEFDPERDFLRWACGIAHNLIRNHLKRHRRQGVCLSEELLERLAELRHSARARLDGQLEQLGRCLDQLPDEQRELLELCYLGEHSIGDLARQRQLAPAALYKRLDRIRWALVDCIQSGQRKEGRP
jgi:RNA polymerase sigma-70 factor (ECF subfamily)